MSEFGSAGWTAWSRPTVTGLTVYLLIKSRIASQTSPVYSTLHHRRVSVTICFDLIGPMGSKGRGVTSPLGGLLPVKKTGKAP